MKLAIAGDSAGEGLALILAEHLKNKHEVSQVSRTDAGADAFYADLSDRVAAALRAALEELGFKVKCLAGSPSVRYIGLTPVSSPASFRPEATKLGTLDAALEHLESQPGLHSRRLRHGPVDRVLRGRRGRAVSTWGEREGF